MPGGLCESGLTPENSLRGQSEVVVLRALIFSQPPEARSRTDSQKRQSDIMEVSMRLNVRTGAKGRPSLKTISVSTIGRKS
jgi:hypothetical protein